MIEIEERIQRSTDEGTIYIIEKWTCPICNEKKSTLFIDNEWCHGDSRSAHFFKGESKEGCSKCIFAT